MARITKLVRTTKDNPRLHDAVPCSYSMFHIGNKQYVQLDTSGTAQRKVVGAISQSIQFDKDIARLLINICLEAFPDLSTDR